ncbi:MAG: hypothetical protein M1837_004668 [Sclerophora amabilis]|nr:MAG: hypothetical protein M1837_004668 [Sclerophora amabilis]
MPINRQFMTNRGTAYILYDATPDAESAIAHMHEAQLDGAVISVSIVMPRRKLSRSPPPARRGPPSLDRYEPRGPPGGNWRGPPPPTYSGGGGRRVSTTIPLQIQVTAVAPSTADSLPIVSITIPITTKKVRRRTEAEPATG